MFLYNWNSFHFNSIVLRWQIEKQELFFVTWVRGSLTCYTINADFDCNEKKQLLLEIIIFVLERVEFKLCSVVYKCLHESAPRYLSQYCIPVASLPGRWHLRSAASGDLFVPATSTKTIGPRGFFHVDPAPWNCLPSSMKDPNITFSVFKKLLKTELFQHWT